MDISAMSTSLSQMKIQQQANISVMKMAMNNSQNQMNDMVKMIETNTKIIKQSVDPNIGRFIDSKA